MPFTLSVSAIVFFILIGILLVIMILFTRAKLVSDAACKIAINGDDSLTKEATAGVTLLSALTTAGVAVPSPCGGKATCKQCKVQVNSGGGPPAETDKATFSPKEIRDGWRLSCQCKLREDISVSLPGNLLELKVFKARVVKNENVATFIKELIVEIEQPIEYIPGDYLQFHVPTFKTNTSDWKETIDQKYWEDWERFSLFDTSIDFSYFPEPVIRAYSMASHPAEGNKLMFNVRIATPPFIKGKLAKRIPWGICSSYVFSLKPGDEVTLSGPFGESHMKGEEEELVFLIGGAGSSFGRSHILDLFLSKNTHRKVTLWYGARSLRENIYEEDFKSLEEKYPNFTYHLVLSEPLPEDLEQGWPKDDPMKTGFLFKAFAKGQLEAMEEPENVFYYVCGPPMHNKSVMQLLDNYGVPPEHIVLDDFGS